MTRPHPLILAASVAVAVVAGISTGDAVSPAAPRGVDAAALARFDVARVHARVALGAAEMPQDRRAAAHELAGVYRRAARTMPAQRAPLLDAANVYDTLGAASAPNADATAPQRAAALTAYTAVADRALRADAALAASLRRPVDPGDPLVPPVLPLVMLAAAAAGGAVSSRRRKPPRRRDAPPPEPPPHKPSWDTPPPFGI